MSQKLIFIYNAESWLWNAISESIHKFVSPETYPCALCDITHGNFWAKKQWNTFLKTIQIPVAFYHKDEIINKPYFSKLSLPCVALIDENNKIGRSIQWDERKTIQSLDDLINIITDHCIKKSF